MEQLVQKTFGYNSFARAKETSVVVSVNARSEPDLTKRYDGLNVDWNEIEDQLIDWSRHFQEGKKLRVNLTFKYSDKDAQPVRPSTRSGSRREVLSATQRMLNERDAQLDAEQESTGHASAWRDVYQLMRCPGPPCPLGPHCWIDPNGKKHFKLSTFVLKEMIKHVENDNILNDHDQVPLYIRDLIYAEDRHRLDRKRKATTPSPAGMTPITINNHFPEHSTSKLPCSDQSEVLNFTHLNDSKPLTIPGLRDVSVREYTAWQQTQVEGERLKAEFGKARDEVLNRGYDLETIHEDQNLAFMNEKVEPGIIRRFARDIPIWARQYKHGE